MVHIFLVNPCAGYYTITEGLQDALSEIGNLRYFIFQSRYPGHEKEIARLAQKIFDDEKIRFYVCGGSGSFRNLLDGVQDLSRHEFAFYPCGLTNDYLKAFGDSRKLFRDIGRLVRGSVVKTDYIQTNMGRAVNSLSVGVDANHLHYFEKLHFTRFISRNMPYALSVILALITSTPHEYNMTIDGTRRTVSTVELMFGNGCCLGGTLYFDRDADITDGVGTGCAAAGKSRAALLRMMNALMKGNEAGIEKYVKRESWTDVVLSRKDSSPMIINLDGEMFRDVRELHGHIVHRGLNFVVPEGVTL